MTVVHPVGVTVARAYLLSWDLVTDITARVGVEMPPATPQPRFPAVRLTDLNSVVVTERRWVRMLLQADCWGTTRAQADNLATTVAAVLGEAANYIPPSGLAVLGDAEDVAWRWEPDETLTPVQPRTIVTCHLPIRPNP